MGNPYTGVAISGYNASPPADDGSTVASNQVTWQKHLDKIGDPVKTMSESINGNILTAFPTRQGGNIIMNIEAYDGLYGQANSITSITLNKGTKIDDAINTISSDLINIEKS